MNLFPSYYPRDLVQCTNIPGRKSSDSEPVRAYCLYSSEDACAATASLCLVRRADERASFSCPGCMRYRCVGFSTPRSNGSEGRAVDVIIVDDGLQELDSATSNDVEMQVVGINVT